MSEETHDRSGEFINPMERQRLHRQLVDAGLAVPIWQVVDAGVTHSIDAAPGETQFTTRTQPQKDYFLQGIVMPLEDGQYLAMSTTGLEEIVLKPSPTYNAYALSRLDLDSGGFEYSTTPKNLLDGIGLSFTPSEIIARSHSSSPEEFVRYYDQAAEIASKQRAERNRLAVANARAGQDRLRQIFNPE